MTVSRVDVGWTPPPHMLASVVSEWKAFFRGTIRTYGLNGTQYRDLYVAQHGVCYICRKAVGKNPDDPRGRGGRRLAVDHNHVTGAVRGLLCSGGDKTCNRIIGWLGIEALRRAVEYVETEPAQTVLALRAELDDRGLSWDAVDARMRQVLELS